MPKLDTYIQPGEVRTLDSAFYNELVDKLGERLPPGPLSVRRSAEEALVHPDGSLVPAAVSLTDGTHWGNVPADEILLTWEISEGVGHLEVYGQKDYVVTSGPGAVVKWTWADTDPGLPAYVLRSWNATPGGSPLPDSIEIVVTAKRLTTSVTDSAVDTLDDLNAIPAPADGERRLVWAEAQVYEYDAGTGSWSPQTTTWAQHDTQTVHLRADRAYDPDYTSAFIPILTADRESAPIAAGAAVFEFTDETLFPTGVSSVTRTASAIYSDGSSAQVTDPAEGQNLLGVPDRTFSVKAERADSVTVSVTYSFNSESHVITRRVSVLPPLRLRVPGDSEPVPPQRLEVIPGNGVCTVFLGEEATLRSIAYLEPLSMPSEPISQLAGQSAIANLLRRLQGGIVGTLIPDSDRVYLNRDSVRGLLTISDLLHGFFARFGHTGMARAEAVVEADQSPTPGNVIYGDGFWLQITELVKQDGQTHTVRGRAFCSDYSVTDLPVVISGTADVFDVEVELGFGDIASTSFPRVRHSVRTQVLPGSGAELVVVLPKETPASLQDGWYARVHLHADSAGALSVTKSTDWTPAESVPAAEPTVEVKHLEEDVYQLTLKPTNFEFYGTATWESSENTSTLSEADLLAQRAPLPNVLVLPAPPSLAGTAQIVLRGHFRARGGTCGRSIRRFVSAPQVVRGLRIIEGPPGLSAPSMGAPEGVVVYRSSPRAWISAGLSWYELAPMTHPPRVISGTIQEEGGSPVPMTLYGLNALSHIIPEGLYTGFFTLQLVFEGNVQKVTRISGPSSSVTFDAGLQAATVKIPASNVPEGVKSSLSLQAETYTGEVAVVSVVLDRVGTASDTLPPSINYIEVLYNGTPQKVTGSGSSWIATHDPNQTGGNLDIKFVFEDSGSGVAYAFVESPGGVAATWDRVTRTLSFSVTGVTTFTTYTVRAGDAAGNESGPITLSIQPAI
ncbi:MAG: hypothetical protein D6800_03140 [Candidatus Zixiibacteriota bacterium]|nr:MAG: hypothetical protein D6800_03140 [candidate division Zixibacteria bacterium]